MNRKALAASILLGLLLTLGVFGVHRETDAPPAQVAGNEPQAGREILGLIERGDTMTRIFAKYDLDFHDLFQMREASAGIHRLRRLAEGQPYTIRLDADNTVMSLTYEIDDEEVLHITRDGSGFRAEKAPIPYEKRIGKTGRVIETNLISSFGEDGESVLLALNLSDIFSWDIDFTTDLRKGDSYRVVVEELWRDGRFARYGDILAAEFINDGMTHRAYRYEVGGRPGYFDEDGKSVRRSFLKAPLSYRRISSGFSRSRFHPILKIRRPHLGVDYAAPSGTPVSSLGDGVVAFAGRKGPNGELVVLKHPNGYSTSYGHLSRIAKGIRRGRRVRQGDVIGRVGSTGLSTGPHLDFRIRKGGRFVNPLSVRLPRTAGVPKKFLADYDRYRSGMADALASIGPPSYATIRAEDAESGAPGR